MSARMIVYVALFALAGRCTASPVAAPLSSVQDAPSGSVEWPDCSAKDDAHTPYNGTAGPYGPVNRFNTTYLGADIVVYTPTNVPAGTKVPVVAFMHGITAEIAMYEPSMELYASHGFAVIFPYIHNPWIDKLPITTNTNGEFLLHAIAFANISNADSTSPFFGKFDMSNVVAAGHSMGATCSIMAGKRVPAGTIKLVVTQHPGICGPTGPPPWPSTWFPTDLNEVISRYPVLFTTATNDGAFWPAPLTAKHELGCFHKATKTPKAGSQPAAFVQFSAKACDKDGARPPYDDSGHNCAFKENVETPWVLTALKLYAQQGGRASSHCRAMLYGTGADSIRGDPHVEQVVYTPATPTTSSESVAAAVPAPTQATSATDADCAGFHRECDSKPCCPNCGECKAHPTKPINICY